MAARPLKVGGVILIFLGLFRGATAVASLRDGADVPDVVGVGVGLALLAIGVALLFLTRARE